MVFAYVVEHGDVCRALSLASTVMRVHGLILGSHILDDLGQIFRARASCYLPIERSVQRQLCEYARPEDEEDEPHPLHYV
jgi:hypothetical protein